MIMEPAVWVVLALVTCLHRTYESGKTLGHIFNWRWLWFVASIPCVFGISQVLSSNVPHSEWPTAMIVGSGIYLSMRTANDMTAKECFAKYVVLAVVVNYLLATLVAQNVYSTGEQGWLVERGAPKGALDTIWMNINANEAITLPSGFIDQVQMPLSSQNASVPTFLGPFTRQVSTPEWYTPLTGLYRVQFRIFHLWTPGGGAKFAANRAVLVETDLSGKRLGGPVAVTAFDSDIVGQSDE